ncbi:GMC family oxidoreductase [Yangia sp. PrR004]|nr:GMC family oxidoreductase [Salipiger sp. PrR004]
MLRHSASPPVEGLAMPLIDARTARSKSYDCIVSGAGPAGLSVALPLAEAGHRVLIVEAGSHEPSPGPDAEYETPQAHAAASITHCRALGGTSWLWGGRTIPLMPHDLLASGWPMDYADLARHYQSAAIFLGASPPEQPFFDPQTTEPFDLNAQEVLANTGSLLQWHRARMEAPYGPDVLLNATATGIILGKSPRGGTHCEGLRVRAQGIPETLELRAPKTVLAQGGIETLRLLLADKVRWPEELGHLQALGRYYAGHLTGSVASIVFRREDEVDAFGWRPLAERGSVRRIFRSTSAAMAEGVNMFFWAQNWPIADAEHGSGLLSAKFLAKRAFRRPEQNTDPLGPGVAAPQRTSAAPAHLQNVLSDGPTVLRGLPGVIRARFSQRRQALDHLVPNGAHRYRLAYHAEQESRAENRIELAGPVEPGKLPKIRIALDFSQPDIDRVVRGHEMLAQSLSSSGIAELQYDAAIGARRAAIRALAQDGYHQTGVARMGADPKDSVVGPDCEVHGIADLFIAGAAVFRSSAGVQPTHSIVALSMRIAEHIAAGTGAAAQRSSSAS